MLTPLEKPNRTAREGVQAKKNGKPSRMPLFLVCNQYYVDKPGAATFFPVFSPKVQFRTTKSLLTELELPRFRAMQS